MTELRGLLATLVLEFKESDDKIKYSTICSISKPETIISKSDIDGLFQSICITIISNIIKSLGKGSVLIIDLVADHTINISKYNPLAGSSCNKLLKELDHPKKVWLIFKILLIINALNGVWWDSYILMTMIKQEFERLTELLKNEIGF